MAYEYDRFDDEGGSGGAFMMGLIAGAVLGAGLGMLLAPRAGSELRTQLGDTASKLRERAAEGYSAASSKVTNLYNRSGSGTATGPTGAGGTYESGGSFAGGTAGTSGYSTGGLDTPSTSTEF
ncbi:MAG: YtxH domain-containing protein [Vicinamibacterales bacterium]